MISPSMTFYAVTGCLRLTPTDNLPVLTGIELAGLRHCGATLALARRVLESQHLFYPKLTRSSTDTKRRLKSRHPFAPVAQDLQKQQ